MLDDACSPSATQPADCSLQRGRDRGRGRGQLRRPGVRRPPGGPRRIGVLPGRRASSTPPPPYAACSATAVTRPEPLRGASEPFARWLAEEIAADLGATWGIGEGGATGPSGNPYGDPAGHCWMAVHGPSPATRHLLTGDDDRLANMTAFATAALQLLVDQLG